MQAKIQKERERKLVSQEEERKKIERVSDRKRVATKKGRLVEKEKEKD
jgi:hypothetical protein